MSSASPKSVSSDRVVPIGSAAGRHREAVVLRGDLDPPGRQVLDRVVAAAVAERQLERLQPDRPGEELVAEADPEHRRLARSLAHVVDQ